MKGMHVEIKKENTIIKEIKQKIATMNFMLNVSKIDYKRVIYEWTINTLRKQKNFEILIMKT